MQESISRKRVQHAAVAGGPPELRHAIFEHLSEVFENATEAADKAELAAASHGRSADLLVLHISLAIHEEDGLPAWIGAGNGSPVVIVFGPHDEAELAEQLQDSGAAAYLPAWRVAGELLQTVDRLMGQSIEGRAL